MNKALPVVAGLVATVGISGVVTVGMLSRSQPTRHLAAAPFAAPTTTAPPLPTTTTTVPTDVPVSTATAAPNGTIPIFTGPGGTQTGTTGTWYGWHLTLPVLAAQGGWLQVRLPLRPNGSIGWVRQQDVTMGATPWHIVVHLGRRELIVYDAGHRTMAFPVGIGLPNTPTPTGNFFVAVREPSPGPGYGPVVLDTSAHSEAIQSWEGASDAVIAIHGPITGAADSEIGAAGARVSNGCIRLHDSDLAQLSVIPLGTPVDITG